MIHSRKHVGNDTMIVLWDAGRCEVGQLGSAAPFAGAAKAAQPSCGDALLAERRWTDYLQCCCACRAAAVGRLAHLHASVWHGLWATDGAVVVHALMYG